MSILSIIILGLLAGYREVQILCEQVKNDQTKTSWKFRDFREWFWQTDQNDKKKLIETSEFIKRELPNIDYLIRILEKMQNDNLNEKPYDQFLRENFGFNCDRFNRLLKDSTMLTPDEIEKVIIYLER